MQLGLWSAEEPPARRPGGSAAGGSASTRGPATELLTRLCRLGLPSFLRFDIHRNRQVMVSWIPGRRLRVHEGYVHAPDAVLRAIVRFVTPGTRRESRLAARQVFLDFPVEAYAPSPERNQPTPRDRPGDTALLAELDRLRGELNRAHFEGRLSAIPIRISGRMRTRLGELRLEHKTGRPVYIGLSRRHLRRDGWPGARETLLHEMIHQWQAETGRPVDHGPEFRRKARELGITPRAIREQ